MASLAGLPTPSGGTYKPYVPTAGKPPSYQDKWIPSLTTYPSYGTSPSYNDSRFSGIAQYQPSPTQAPAPSPAPLTSRPSPTAPTRQPTRRVRRGTQPQIPSGLMSYWQAPKTRPEYTGHPHRKSRWEARYGHLPEKPVMGELPKYMMPEFSQERISELQELAMGAPMGRLRRGLQQSLIGSRYIENPAVRAMIERETLGGYGAGISDIRTGAGAEAYQRYMPEYGAQVTKAGAEYQAELGKFETQFQTDLEEYIRKGRQITIPLMPEMGGRTYRQPRITG